jgi:hypothetical protein
VPGEQPLPVPQDAVWFYPADFKELLYDWLQDYIGVDYAQDAMDKSHGDWTK